MKTRSFFLLSIITLASILLAGCAPAANRTTEDRSSPPVQPAMERQSAEGLVVTMAPAPTEAPALLGSAARLRRPA